ncbi:hypothetical protein EDC18_11033 [Natranaerovirga pectinivora]|uniref:DUF4179 domain-containing protein n=1 Tax=Natranaerovirga pectinivora TaxID=682400 RepID=A0A4R3MH08_9FIRM|nr:hypothetical protein [Natranaerovirga pectinivora]TCT12959.1 hypothetical protein EDC18_11033 [Natranaerovirga pectinivora]
MEKGIKELLDDLEIEETEKMINKYSFSTQMLGEDDLEDIKNLVSKKTGITIKKNKVEASEETHKKSFLWKSYAASFLVVLTIIMAWNGDNIVQGIHRMFNLVPGVGIVEDEEILYALKSKETVETESGRITVENVIVTESTMRIDFEYERKDISEEELIKILDDEWERLIKEDQLTKPNISVLKNGESIDASYNGGVGGGLISRNYLTLELSESVSVLDVFTVDYEDFNISVDFQLIELEYFNSLDEIGATKIHNNISLTGVAKRDEDHLFVNVYPLNYSKYTLISFNYEYDLEFRGQKIELITDKGSREYSLPSSFGSGINATYTFDISDDSKEFLFKIPFIAVESNERSRVTLPIPEGGLVEELNKVISFQDSDLIITSVERTIDEFGFGHGHLIINFDYKNTLENKELVGVRLTRGKSEGWYEEYDDDGRMIAIGYALEKSDRNHLRLNIEKPRYILTDEYNLILEVQ